MGAVHNEIDDVARKLKQSGKHKVNSDVRSIVTNHYSLISLWESLGIVSRTNRFEINFYLFNNFK